MNNILIPIPVSLVQEAIDCGIIQTTWTPKSAELRSREVERREKHFAELVIAIINKELNKQKRLPYNPR
jgi:hypothetical protein